MKVSSLLDNIDNGSIALPEFQRGYVWNREQVRGLMDSLYRKYPVGSLLVWTTRTENADARGEGALAAGVVKLLLDGQQRITTLYGVIRGKAPAFFEGNATAFTGLYFNVDEEKFEFYAPMKMSGNASWIDVSKLMRSGIGPYIQTLGAEMDSDQLTIILGRLNALHSIRDIDFHVEEVTGEDKTVDVVVEIFNKVNSGGTKLSKGDLALAKVCASWPDARSTMNSALARWAKSGYRFRLEWLMRVVNAVATGESMFHAMERVDIKDFRTALDNSERYVDWSLNLIASRLGLDHEAVLKSVFALPVFARYCELSGGRITNYRDRDKLLYWYVQTLLWGRYAGSTETVLQQDLRCVASVDGALDRLIAQLRQNRGDLRVRPDDFIGWSQGARFYPLLYMLTRVYGSVDLDTGVLLSQNLLGRTNRLEVHHVFPKALLYKHDYSRSEVNALGNYAFMTQATNIRISDRAPWDYLAEFEERNLGCLKTHWIPDDRELWKVENYLEFLAARRELLAKAANDFLDSLLGGDLQETMPRSANESLEQPAGMLLSEEAESIDLLVKQCSDYASANGLPEGELLFEIADPKTGAPLAVVDLAWPDGLQEGLSQPVAVLVESDREIEELVNAAGYRFFTDYNSFNEYVHNDVLAASRDE